MAFEQNLKKVRELALKVGGRRECPQKSSQCQGLSRKFAFEVVSGGASEGA